MSGFGNKNVRLFEHFVPIFALKSYCWVKNPTYNFKIYIHEIIVKQTNPKIDNDTIFECKSNNPQQNIEDFQNAKIFEGKSFWEVEQEITWID